MNRQFALLLSALLLSLAAVPARTQEAAPQDAQASDAEAVRDKLMTSLFFRGEVADGIIGSGEAGRFVDLSGVDTYAGERSALLAWIAGHPDEAARVWLELAGGGGRLHDGLTKDVVTWKLRRSFLEDIKALQAAAEGAGVSGEAMEMAERRLYGGAQAEGAPYVNLSGAKGSAGGGLRPSDYADFRPDRAGLDREVARLGDWLASAKPLSGGEAAGAYARAFSLYRDFVVEASSLKGREAMTGAESAGLEALRTRLRAALTSLTMLGRSLQLGQAALTLASESGEPGAAELLASLRELQASLESAAAGADGQDLRELASELGAAEDRFAAAYLSYTAYDGLLALKRRAAPRGFSCLYDYAAFRLLSVFLPSSRYLRERALLESSHGALDAALEKAGRGDPAAALAGLDVRGLSEAAADVRAASDFNRAAEFFSWGVFFRPLELRLTAGGKGASLRPVFTLAEVFRVGRGRRPAR